MKKIFLVVVLLASIFSSCGDEEVVLDPLKTGQAYYPMEVGTYWVYNVTETTYRNNVPTKANFQTRELVKGVSKDQAGKEWFTIEVSKRLTANDSWLVMGTKTISKTVNDIQLQENNRTTVLMIFPVTEGKEWNPNAYNKDYNFEDEPQNQSRYVYQNVGGSFEKSSKTYPNTVKVSKELSPADDLINEVEIYEIFAAELGPVYRYTKDRYNCDASSGTTCEVGSGYILSGTDRIEELDSSGKI